MHEYSKEVGIKDDNDESCYSCEEKMRESVKEGGIRDENFDSCRFSEKFGLFKRILSMKLFHVEDLSSFGGDYFYHPPSSGWGHSWDEVSAAVRYELEISRIQREDQRSGMHHVLGMPRYIARQLYYQRRVLREAQVLKNRFADLKKAFLECEKSSTKGMSDFMEVLKDFTARNEQKLEEGLEAIKLATHEDLVSRQRTYDELASKLKSMDQKEISPFLSYIDNLVRTVEIPVNMRKRLSELRKELFMLQSLAIQLLVFVTSNKLPAPPSVTLLEEANAKYANLPLPVLVSSEVKAPRFYRSFGKDSKDLLYKHYCSDAPMTSKTIVNFDMRGRSSLSMLLSTDQQVMFKCNYADNLPKNLMATMLFGVPSSNSKVKLQYLFPYGGLNGSFNFGEESVLKVAFSGGYDRWYAGGKVKVNTCNAMKHYEFGVSYESATIKLINSDILKISLFDRPDSAISGAMELRYTRSSNTAVAAAGVSWTPDDKTKFKARVASNGEASLLLQHRASSSIDFSASAMFNFRALHEAPKVGFSFDFRPAFLSSFASPPFVPSDSTAPAV